MSNIVKATFKTISTWAIQNSVSFKIEGPKIFNVSEKILLNRLRYLNLLKIQKDNV